MTTPYQRIIAYLDDDIGRNDLKAAGVYDRRIQRSLAKFHRKEFWVRDIVETTINFTDQTLSLQAIDLRDFPRFRKLAYLRDYDPNVLNTTVVPNTYGLPGEFYREIGIPFGVQDYFGYDNNYVFYRAGEILSLRSRAPLKAASIGYFTDPLVEPVASINSWIADLYPELIAADVCVRVFGDIGKDEEKKSAEMERAEFEMALLINNIYTSVQKG